MKKLLLVLLLLVPVIAHAKITSRSLAKDNCVNMVTAFFDPTEAGATDDYLRLTGDGSSNTTSELLVDQYIVPVAAHASGLRAVIDAAPGAGNDEWTVTLRDDASSTALTCTIDETATGCTDTSNISSLAAGSKLTVLVSSTTNVDTDPDAAGEVVVSFCLTP